MICFGIFSPGVLRPHARDIGNQLDQAKTASKYPGDVNACEIFETLNDRVLQTSQVDLVKSCLVGRSDIHGTGALLPSAFDYRVILENGSIDYEKSALAGRFADCRTDGKLFEVPLTADCLAIYECVVALSIVPLE